ncbi:MAG TPA: hypothetical protein PLZ77_01420 [Lachnospiraceae bacterium]|nr:hypothetical protein [Lachnospiraceae bacterium]HPF28744.1 hypothetical protein [Lachnospiraceae bacterium]
MKKKKKDNGDVVGFIIGICFLLLLVGGGYYLFTMFKPIDVTVANVRGNWKLPGAPVTYWEFNLDGTASSYEKFTGTNEVRNETSYTYEIEDGDIVLRPDGAEGTYTIQITSLSRLQMSVILNASDIKSMTRVDIF